MIDNQTLLIRQKNDLLRQLVELSSNRDEARTVVDELRTVTDELLTYLARQKTQFAHMKQARDAFKVVFDESQRTWRQKELIDEILRRGWRGGDTALNRLNAGKAIKLLLNTGRKRKYPLKRLHNLLGPADWPKEMFQEEKQSGDQVHSIPIPQSPKTEE